MKKSFVLIIALLLLAQVFVFAATTEYVLEASSLKAFAAGTKKDGDFEVAGTNDYFTIFYSAKSKIDGSSKSWKDGYSSSQRINLQGAASVSPEKNVIKFNTSCDNALVKVWWVEGGDDFRQVVCLDPAGTEVCSTNEKIAKNGLVYSELIIPKAGTYYLGSLPNNNYFFKISVTDNSGYTPVAVQPVTVKSQQPVVITEEPVVKAQSYDFLGRTWEFSASGTSTNTEKNGCEVNAKEGKVTVFSEGGKGKIVPNSTDGLAYFYTTIDPEKENFTLKAKITVDSWTYSNGQEGFGILIGDTVGQHGSTASVWNNSLMLLSSKIEYKNEDGNTITMKMGVGTLARTGVTQKDSKDFVTTGGFIDADGKETSLPVGFKTETTTLEDSCATLVKGTYNIIGNYTSEPAGTRKQQEVTELWFEATRNNTGYLFTYKDKDGEIVGQKMIYDTDRSLLTQIDPSKIYLGFFASRNARVTVSDIQLTTIDPKNDAQAEQQEITYIEPVYSIESSTTANSPNYTLVYYGNVDGTLSIRGDKGKIVDKVHVKAEEKYRALTQLSKGYNVFDVEFVPDSNYQPSPYTKLSSYGAKILSITVEYKTYDGTNLYVSPTGRASGKGTRSNPLDIYTAVKFVQPGQKIVLLSGTYKLTQPVRVDRGINGTKSKHIYLVADDNSKRPVFDFSQKCAGFIFGGDYWIISGFDVTNTLDGQKGLQVSGDNNIVENVYAYKNGNTGIQISRLFGSDTYEDWPSNNIVRGCVSFMNADVGFEDADGFAAKLTIADGNSFSNCISAYNADDGWDLYAKVETGNIGSVTITNCISFKNGFYLDEKGKEIPAGNGNGFKMGGESLSGKHVLENSVSFENKGKGIDSNSCPDIIVKNCTSFNNGSYNVAFYTNNAVNTAFKANNVITCRTNSVLDDQIKLKGNQKQEDVMNNSNKFNASSSIFKNTDSASVISSFIKFTKTLNWKDSIVKITNGIVSYEDFLKLK